MSEAPRGLNLTHYEYILENLLRPPNKTDYLLIKITVPITLVGLFLVILLIIYIKCGSKTKPCTAVGSGSRRSSRSSRCDGTVKSTWKRVKTKDILERKLPPIPEETSEVEPEQKNQSNPQSKENDSSGGNTPEGHVYAEIHLSEGAGAAVEEGSKHIEQNKALTRPTELALTTFPDLVHDYIHLPTVETPDTAPQVLTQYVSYTFPYNDPITDRRISSPHSSREDSATPFHGSRKDSATPYHVSCFIDSGPTSLESCSTSITYTTFGDPGAEPGLRSTQGMTVCRTTLTLERRGRPKTPDDRAEGQVWPCCCGSSADRKGGAGKLEGKVCRQCTREVSPLYTGNLSGSLDSGELGWSYPRLSGSPGGKGRQLKRLQRHDKKERARLLSCSRLKLADSESLCDYYSTF